MLGAGRRCCELAVRGGDRVPGAGAGAGRRCWCCELAVHVMETGCWRWCRVPVLVLAVHVVETGCWRWCWVPVLVLLAGCARGGDRLLVLVLAGCRCWCCELAVLVGWRPSPVGWKPWLVGWTPWLVGWRPSLVGLSPSVVGWRPSLLETKTKKGRKVYDC